MEKRSCKKSTESVVEIVLCVKGKPSFIVHLAQSEATAGANLGFVQPNVSKLVTLHQPTNNQKMNIQQEIEPVHMTLEPCFLDLLVYLLVESEATLSLKF